MGWTIFAEMDLSEAEGLETVKHEGPSTVGIDTLYRSRGGIPVAFLRGAGVPEDFIMDSQRWWVRIRFWLGIGTIQFYSCYISYSSEDEPVARRLCEDLRRNEVRVWYLPEKAKWAKAVEGEFDRSERVYNRVYDKLVVICSEKSLQSRSVRWEIDWALLREERTGRRVLFPIQIDDYLVEGWEDSRKADVMANVIDFRVWDRKTGQFDEVRYREAFKKLLEALQTGDKES